MAETQPARGQPNDVAEAATPAHSEQAFSYWKLIRLKFFQNKLAVGGATVLALLYPAVFLAEFVAPYSHEQHAKDLINAPPQRIRVIDAEGRIRLRPLVYGFTKETDPVTLRTRYFPDPNQMFPIHLFERGPEYRFLGITSDIHLFGARGGYLFLLGTDSQGRDVFSRLVYGGRISLTIGLLGVVISLLLGSVIGLLSGYFGGTVDTVIQRAIEILLSFPTIPLWLALSAAVPVTWSPLVVYFAITIIISIIGWGQLARVVRGMTLALKTEESILAARVNGANTRWILLRHLLPGNVSYLIVAATLAVPAMIIGETALSFLGLGMRPPMYSWGVLLQAAQDVTVLRLYPWQVIPVAAVVVSVLCYNFMGDGLRDAADPFAHRSTNPLGRSRRLPRAARPQASVLHEELREEVLLDVRDLHVSFEQVTGVVRAVNGVSFTLKQGEILGVVGESGCGKSVTAHSILGLLPMPPAKLTGRILLSSKEGSDVDLAALPQHGKEMRQIRGQEISMIFQEPMRSLHPLYTIGHQIMEGLSEHQDVSEKESTATTLHLLGRVGLPEPARVIKDYPHQLSGGMRQRAMIAIALACNPRLLIADEPTTALDVTIQAQILELIQELQAEIGLSIILISHDLGVIAETADKVLVMYLGTVAEYANTTSLFEQPLHPYSQALLETAPTLVGKPRVRLSALAGVVPELKEAPAACVFADRCDHVFERCTREAPPALTANNGHEVRCWLHA